MIIHLFVVGVRSLAGRSFVQRSCGNSSPKCAANESTAKQATANKTISDQIQRRPLSYSTISFKSCCWTSTQPQHDHESRCTRHYYDLGALSLLRCSRLYYHSRGGPSLLLLAHVNINANVTEHNDGRETSVRILGVGDYLPGHHVGVRQVGRIAFLS